VTVLSIVGGSAGVPSACSRLMVKVIRFSLRQRLEPDGQTELIAVRGPGRLSTRT
jgi:hypothetical protein